MTQEFTVSGTLPGANDCLWKHWRKVRTIKQAAQCQVRHAIRKANLKPMNRVVVTFEWREPNQRRDCDNVMFGQKFVLDALVESRIIRDDGWANVRNIKHTVVLEAKNPGVRVTLEEC